MIAGGLHRVDGCHLGDGTKTGRSGTQFRQHSGRVADRRADGRTILAGQRQLATRGKRSSWIIRESRHISRPRLPEETLRCRDSRPSVSADFAMGCAENRTCFGTCNKCEMQLEVTVS